MSNNDQETRTENGKRRTEDKGSEIVVGRNWRINVYTNRFQTSRNDDYVEL